jgi:hypothetical protein
VSRAGGDTIANRPSIESAMMRATSRDSLTVLTERAGAYIGPRCKGDEALSEKKVETAGVDGLQKPLRRKGGDRVEPPELPAIRAATRS